MNDSRTLRLLEASLDAALDELLDVEDEIGCLRYLDPEGCPDLVRLRARHRRLTVRTDVLTAAVRPLQVVAAEQRARTAEAASAAGDRAEADEQARASVLDAAATCTSCGVALAVPGGGVCQVCADLYGCV